MEQMKADVDHVLLGGSWGKFFSLARDSIMVVQDNQPIPSPLPPDPAWLELNTQPEPVPEHSQVGGYGPCHPGAYSQAQDLPDEWPLNGVPRPTAPANSHPAAAPSHTYNNVPTVRLPEGFYDSLQCVGMMNGEPIYTLPAGVFPPPSVPAAPQPSTSNSNKRKAESEQEGDRPYVKRPPNAFMLYMKEHRSHVEEDIRRMGNVAVNRVLGERWKSLSAEQQAIYYQQAKSERELHALRNPGWSVCQNYGKKKKKTGGKASKVFQHPRGCVCHQRHPPHGQLLMEASPSQSAVEEPRPPQTVSVPSQTTPGGSRGAAATGTGSSDRACE